MLKKLILTFFAGILLGSGITWIVKSGNCTASKHPDNTNVADELRIAPLFAEDMEKLQIYRSFYDSLLSGGNFVWRTSDMEILASTCAFFGEVELYLLANAHLKTLPDNQKADFIKHYNRWLDEYKQKIQQPFYDKDGITKLEGTMTIPMYPGRKDSLLQEFLKTLPGRIKAQKGLLYTKEDFE